MQSFVFFSFLKSRSKVEETSSYLHLHHMMCHVFIVSLLSGDVCPETRLNHEMYLHLRTDKDPIKGQGGWGVHGLRS